MMELDERAQELVFDTTAQVVLTKIEERLKARDRKGARKIIVDSFKRMYDAGVKK